MKNIIIVENVGGEVGELVLFKELLVRERNVNGEGIVGISYW